LLGCGLEV